jgi:putative transport protein
MIPLAAAFFEWFPRQSVGLTCLIIALTAATGLALGAIKIRGFSLGIPGVMFTGLVIARILSKSSDTPCLNEQVIGFVRSFGLVLFVYAVGIQVGPGFFASLRKNGLPLNLMAAAIVILGAGIAVGMAYVTPYDVKTTVGLFAGGTTNAPALESATEALKTLHGDRTGAEESAQSTAPALAISYPFGLLGVIVAMVALKLIFRSNPIKEAEALEAADRAHKPSLATLNIELKNPNLNGVRLADLPSLDKTSVVVSRVLHNGVLTIPTAETIVHQGDVILAVGTHEELKDLRMIAGEESSIDLRALPSSIVTRNVYITHKEVLGKSVNEMDLPRRFGVAVTRITRAGLEFTAVGDLRLQFGDRVRLVGDPEDLSRAAKVLGDSMRDLNHPRLLPIFIGILLGVMAGSIPFSIPGLPVPVKLGLAAGPLIIAIILARIGQAGNLLWYMPHSASQMLREIGITLFLICVALLAGDGFFNTLQSSAGLYWLALGAVITIVPLMLVGLVARMFFKTSYLHTCGLLCGSMTSPSLAFTHTMTPSEAPAVAFATVYPLTMILRVLLAQVIILIFAR